MVTINTNNLLTFAIYFLHVRLSSLSDPALNKTTNSHTTANRNKLNQKASSMETPHLHHNTATIEQPTQLELEYLSDFVVKTKKSQINYEESERTERLIKRDTRHNIESTTLLPTNISVSTASSENILNSTMTEILCDELRDENCVIDHTKVCVGDKQYCNLTYEEYMGILYEYITPTPSEWILIVSHAFVFIMGLVSINVTNQFTKLKNRQYQFFAIQFSN